MLKQNAGIFFWPKKILNFICNEFAGENDLENNVQQGSSCQQNHFAELRNLMYILKIKGEPVLTG